MRLAATAAALVISLIFQFVFMMKNNTVDLYLFLFILSLALLVSMFEQVFKDEKMFPGRREVFVYDAGGRAGKAFFIVSAVFFAAAAAVIFRQGIIPLPVQVIMIAAGAVMFVLSPKRERRGADVKKNHFILSTIALVLVFAAASFVRIYLLGEKFGGLNTDESLFAIKAIEIMEGRMPPTVFIGHSDHQMGSAAYYMTAFFFKYLGVSLFSLRLVTAIGGALAAGLFFIFLRMFFPWHVALAASLLFSFSHVNIHTSRWVHIFPLTPVFMWGGMAALVYAFRRNSFLAAAAAGAVAAWSLYFYNANKFLPVIFGIYFIYEAVSEARRENKFHLKKNLVFLALFSAGFLLAFFPLLNYIINNSSVYFHHISTVKGSVGNLAEILPFYAGMFTVKGTINTWLNFAGQPLLGKMAACLFLAGLGMAAVSAKKPASFMALLFLVIGVMPAMLSNYWAHPNNQRAVIAFTSSFLFIAIALNAFMGSMKGRKAKIIFFTAVFAVLYGSFSGINTYFNKMLNDYETKLNFSPVEFNIAGVINKKYGSHDIFVDRYFMGGQHSDKPFVGDIIYFYKKSRPEILDKAAHSMDSMLMASYGEKPALLIVSSFHKNSYDYIKKRFPNAEFESRESGFVKPAGVRGESDYFTLPPDEYDRSLETVIFTIPYEDIKSFKGLRAYGKDGTLLEKNLMFDGSSAPVTRASVIAGSMKIKENGDYYFKFLNAAEKDVRIGGKLIKGESGIYGPVELYEGHWPFSFEAQKITGKEKILYKKTGDGKFTLPLNDLWTADRKENGLKGIYYSHSVDEGKAEIIRREIAPAVHFKWLLDAIPGQKWMGWEDAMKAEWAGKIYLTQNGEHEFIIDAPGGDAKVYVDGSLTAYYECSKPGRRLSIKNGKVKLKKGMHNIKVEAAVYSIGMWCSLAVKLPGGALLSPVPESMFYYE